MGLSAPKTSLWVEWKEEQKNNFRNECFIFLKNTNLNSWWERKNNGKKVRQLFRLDGIRTYSKCRWPEEFNFSELILVHRLAPIWPWDVPWAFSLQIRCAERKLTSENTIGFRSHALPIATTDGDQMHSNARNKRKHNRNLCVHENQLHHIRSFHFRLGYENFHLTQWCSLYGFTIVKRIVHRWLINKIDTVVAITACVNVSGGINGYATRCHNNAIITMTKNDLCAPIKCNLPRNATIIIINVRDERWVCLEFGPLKPYRYIFI